MFIGRSTQLRPQLLTLTDKRLESIGRVFSGTVTFQPQVFDALLLFFDNTFNTLETRFHGLPVHYFPLCGDAPFIHFPQLANQPRHRRLDHHLLFQFGNNQHGSPVDIASG